MWTYDDMFWAIVAFITRDLRDTDFTLNFSDQALVKFKLLNIHTNCSTRWISVIIGEMIK